jgi:hypothetical protein
MTRRRFGQGNGPGWAKRMRANRRIGEHVRSLDERDVGVRVEMSDLFGFGDPRGWVSSWRGLALRWLTRSV